MPINRPIFVNLVDSTGKGKPNMVSFLDEKGSIGLAVDTTGSGKVDHVYIFQDVTGDGKMDMEDEHLLKEKANELLAKGQITTAPMLIRI